MAQYTEAQGTFIPTFCFWGNAFLNDAIRYMEGGYHIFTRVDIDYQNTGIYDNMSQDGQQDNSGTLNIVSGVQFRGDQVYNKDSGKRYGTSNKFLCPFFLDSQMIYSSIDASTELRISDKSTSQQMRALNLSTVIKNILNTFSNHYLYTKNNFTVPNANLYLLDANNVCYSPDINNTITVNQLILTYDWSKVSIGDQPVSNLLDTMLSTHQDNSKLFSNKSSNSTKENLLKICTYNIQAVAKNLTFSYTANEISQDIQGVSNTSAIGYPVSLKPAYDDSTATNSNGNTKAKETEEGQWIYKTNGVLIYPADTSGNALDIHNFYTVEDYNIQAHPFDLSKSLLPITVDIDESTSYATLILNNDGKYIKNLNVIPNNIYGGDSGQDNNLPSQRSLDIFGVYKGSARAVAPVQESYKHNHSGSDYTVATYCNLPINVALINDSKYSSLFTNLTKITNK